MAKEKTVKKKAAKKAAPAKKKAAAKISKKAATAKKTKAPAKKSKIQIRSGVNRGANEAAPMRKGPGTGSAGQSGDIQGLSRIEDVDSESVKELAEEGQDFEASVISGVENARDPHEGEVTTKEVPEDDVPSEYLDSE